MTKSREKRWVLITEDGGHSWLGRHTDPSDEELLEISNALRRAGAAGWLAIVEGVYHRRGTLTVMEVRPLYGVADWEKALISFHEKRRLAVEAPRDSSSEK